MKNRKVMRKNYKSNKIKLLTNYKQNLIKIMSIKVNDIYLKQNQNLLLNMIKVRELRHNQQNCENLHKSTTKNSKKFYKKYKK